MKQSTLAADSCMSGGVAARITIAGVDVGRDRPNQLIKHFCALCVAQHIDHHRGESESRRHYYCPKILLSKPSKFTINGSHQHLVLLAMTQ